MALINPLSSWPLHLRNACVFAVVPCTGSMRDWSLLSTPIIYLINNGSQTWVLKNDVVHLKGGYNASNNYTYNPRHSLAGDSWTCFTSGNPFVTAGANVFFRAFDGVQKFSWYQNSGAIRVYDGANFSNLTLDFTNHTSLATICDPGGFPQSYVDGEFYGTHNLTVTLAPTTEYLRAMHSDSGAIPSQEITSLLMFDSKLTADDIQQLHVWSQQLKTPAHAKRFAGFPRQLAVETPLAGGWDLGTLASTTVHDFSAGGHDGTANGIVTVIDTNVGKAMEFDGTTGYIEIGDTGETCRTFELVVTPDPYGPELLIDGDMEQIGVGAWDPVGSAILSKEGADPHGGAQNLRATYDSVANPGAAQHILTVGRYYRTTGWGRGDGVRLPRADVGGTQAWIGTTSGAWQSFDAVTQASSSITMTYWLIGSAGYTEWDDLSVRQVLPDQKIIDLNGGTNVIELVNHVFTATGFTAPTVYLDGVADGTGLTINRPYHVVITTNTGVSVSNLLLGRQGANFFGGTVKSFTMYQDAKDATWIARRYRQFAQQPTLVTDPDGWWCTFANVWSGVVANTPYTRTSGTWAVEDDGDGKCIRCVSTGQLTKSAIQGYGGSLELRRANATYTRLLDAVDATSINLITGDRIRQHAVVAAPVHQSQRHFTWTTTDLSQSWTIRVTNGIGYWIDWGDGVVSSYTGNGADQVVSKTYTTAGRYCVSFGVDGPENLLYFVSTANALTGTLPDIGSYVNLVSFQVWDNALTGTMVDLSNNPLLTIYTVQVNQLTGDISCISSNTALVSFSCRDNQFTGYSASTIATTCTTFRADNNALSLAAVDGILTDFTTGAGGRPGTGTINLSGGTNSAPSAAVLLAAQMALPGWTITTN